MEEGGDDLLLDSVRPGQGAERGPLSWDCLAEDRDPSLPELSGSGSLLLELFFLACFRFLLFFLRLDFFFSFLAGRCRLDRLDAWPGEPSWERDHAESLLSPHLVEEWSFSLFSQRGIKEFLRVGWASSPHIVELSQINYITIK